MRRSRAGPRTRPGRRPRRRAAHPDPARPVVAVGDLLVERPGGRPPRAARGRAAGRRSGGRSAQLLVESARSPARGSATSTGDIGRTCGPRRTRHQLALVRCPRATPFTGSPPATASCSPATGCAPSSPQGRFAAGAALIDGRVLTDADGARQAPAAPLRRRPGRARPPRAVRQVHRRRRRRPAAGRRGPAAAGTPATATGSTCAGRPPARCSTRPAVDALRARLGPDPLRDDATRTRAYARIARSGKPIAALLLDQSIVAGGGLIFVLETLFRAGLAPTRPARSIDPDTWCALWTDLRGLMREAVQRRADRHRPHRTHAGGDAPAAAGRPARRRGVRVPAGRPAVPGVRHAGRARRSWPAETRTGARPASPKLARVVAAIELYFDHAAERRVRVLWDALEAAGVPSLRGLLDGRHRPHLSLAVAEELDPAAVAEALAASTSRRRCAVVPVHRAVRGPGAVARAGADGRAARAPGRGVAAAERGRGRGCRRCTRRARGCRTARCRCGCRGRCSPRRPGCAWRRCRSRRR